MVKTIFRKSLRVPNPLWYAGAAVVYPYRRAKARLFPPKPLRTFCDNCGTEVTPSLWGFCSEECLAALTERK